MFIEELIHFVLSHLFETVDAYFQCSEDVHCRGDMFGCDFVIDDNSSSDVWQCESSQMVDDGTVAVGLMRCRSEDQRRDDGHGQGLTVCYFDENPDAIH